MVLSGWLKQDVICLAKLPIEMIPTITYTPNPSDCRFSRRKRPDSFWDFRGSIIDAAYHPSSSMLVHDANLCRIE